MAPRNEKSRETAGYTALYARYDVNAPAPRHASFIGGTRCERESTPDGRVQEVFPGTTKRPETDVEHLVFALKRDGTDLLALDLLFRHIDPEELASAVRAKPTSKYLRRLWMFYETLTGTRLEVEDLRTGNYEEALDPKEYVVRDNGPTLRRYRLRWNLLGYPGWCPIVRWTDELRRWHAARLHDRARTAVAQIPAKDLARAVRWLIAKDTKASFEIEREAPSTRAQRFVDTLLTGPCRNQFAWGVKEFNEIQAALLDGRFVDDGWREREVCVSEVPHLAGAVEVVHHVGTRASDLGAIMDAFRYSWVMHQSVEEEQLREGALVIGGKPYAHRRSSPDPFVDLVVAACLSFGFVFIHPLSDGNGRVHRLLLSHVLRMTEHVSPKVPLPIAASIAADPIGYDEALEDFSRRALPFVDYAFDGDGELEVLNDTVHLYRYPDLTAQTEAVCRWYSQAIEEGLVDEVDLLQKFDEAKRRMQEVVDLPGRLERLVLQWTYHNGARGIGYRVGHRKREKYLAKLTDDEVAKLEAVIAAVFEPEREGQ